MDIPTHAELVERIDAFLQRHDMAPSRLGREVTGEPNLIFSIREGRQPNLDTLNRLANYMAELDAALPLAEDVKADWPLPSANNGAEIIGTEDDTMSPGEPAQANASAPSPSADKAEAA